MAPPVSGITLLLLASLLLPQPRRDFVLATTTSVDNSGLLGELRTAFERETGLRMNVLVVGSGKALRLGADGDADVLITHDPDAEARFAATGRALLHRPFMWNEFVLVGPPQDPARVRKSATIEEALRSIDRQRQRFAARGDGSGTSTRELALWKRAGVDPLRNPNYISLGQSMATLLRSANELRAYALADRATFEQFAPRLELKIVYSGGTQLRNVYAVTLVKPRRPSPSTANAQRFCTWLLSPAGRRVIESFRISGRQQFFWLTRQHSSNVRR